jgi:dihydrofolate reductase
VNGGTTFDFLDASLAQALARARQAAAGGDVRIGGGPSSIRQFLAADLIDYLHIVVVLEERFQIEAVNSPSGLTHVTLSRRQQPAAGQGTSQRAGQSRSAPHDRLQWATWAVP